MISNAQEARAKTEAAIAKQEEAKQQNINVLYYSILKGVESAANEGQTSLNIEWLSDWTQSCGQSINHIKQQNKVALKVVDFKKVYFGCCDEVRERLLEGGFGVITGYDVSDNLLILQVTW